MKSIPRYSDNDAIFFLYISKSAEWSDGRNLALSPSKTLCDNISLSSALKKTSNRVARGVVGLLRPPEPVAGRGLAAQRGARPGAS